MMRKPCLAALALTVGAFGVGGAQVPGPSTRVSPKALTSALKAKYQARSVLSVAGKDPNDPLYATPKGGAYDGVAALFIERSDINAPLGALCTGTLMSNGLSILTAAHCLADDTGHLVATRATAVFFPPGQPPTVREFVIGTQFAVNPLYTGEVVDAHDVGVIRLSAAPSAGITRYGLAPGNVSGSSFNVAGSGAVGTGATGYTGNGGFQLTNRHQGNNTYDYSLADPFFGGFFNGFFGNADPNVLVSDFDNGTQARNSSCLLAAFFAAPPPGFCGLGFGASEVTLGGGDSGGPGFVNGRIASVNSFILSFGSGIGDQDDLLNGTFGEFGGYVQVDANRQWILSAAPEPGTLVLLVTGMIGVFAVGARRRRQS